MQGILPIDFSSRIIKIVTTFQKEIEDRYLYFILLLKSYKGTDNETSLLSL